jgi:hypothetical protein
MPVFGFDGAAFFPKTDTEKESEKKENVARRMTQK